MERDSSWGAHRPGVERSLVQIQSPRSGAEPASEAPWRGSRIGRGRRFIDSLVPGAIPISCFLNRAPWDSFDAHSRTSIGSAAVAVLDFHTLMRPLLVLTEDGAEHDIAAVRIALADQFPLSEADQSERTNSRRVTTPQNRVG